MVSLGIEVDILPVAVEEVIRRGGLVVAQLNPRMPFTGGDAVLRADAIDLGVEVDAPLPSPTVRRPDAVTGAIGEQVARYAVDGATIQLGIGQIPDAAAAGLRARRGLGVWTEMLSDGMLDLEKAGALDPDLPLCASFLFGSQDLYARVDGNPRLEMRRTEIINSPALIAAQPAMLSVNTALQADMFAQVNAAYVRSTIYSGFGGQPDFVAGALHSPGGHAVIGLRSWHDATDASNIVPLVRHPVTSFQHSASSPSTAAPISSDGASVSRRPRSSNRRPTAGLDRNSGTPPPGSDSPADFERDRIGRSQPQLGPRTGTDRPRFPSMGSDGPVTTAIAPSI